MFSRVDYDGLACFFGPEEVSYERVIILNSVLFLTSIVTVSVNGLI